MIRAYRLTKTKHVATALTGIGASSKGQRWNPMGTPVVYTADSRALAVLEVLTGIDIEDARTLDYSIIPVEIDENLVQTTTALPMDWDLLPPPDSTKQFGKDWVESMSSVILRVPSVVVPHEYNYILNPNHPDFKKINVLPAEKFSFDKRF